METIDILLLLGLYYLITLGTYAIIHHLDVNGEYSRPFPNMAWFFFFIPLIGFILGILFTTFLIFEHHLKFNVNMNRKNFDERLFGKPMNTKKNDDSI